LGITTDTTYTDTEPENGEINFYIVVSFDVHKNGSLPSPYASVDLSSSGIECENGIPTEFGFAQNYPNPFNPSTITNYELRMK
jgi:hypothetical protein